jgi:hypothetical protein
MTDKPKRRVIPQTLLRWPIYQALRAGQRRIVDEMMKLYQEQYMKERKEEAVRFSERFAAATCGISRETASGALITLEALGFIECVMRGEKKAKGKPALWRLTMFPYKGEPPTNEFLDLRRQERLFKAKLIIRAAGNVVDLQKARKKVA